MNREELAERCQGLGLTKMSPSVITNIESGRRVKGSPRRTVSIDELVVFALALSVPISRLLVPYPEQDTMQLTPSFEVPTTDVLAWLEAEKLLDPAGNADAARWNEARLAVSGIKIHDQLLRNHRQQAERVAYNRKSLQEAEMRGAEAESILDAFKRGDDPVIFRGEPVNREHLETLETALLVGRETETLIRKRLEEALKRMRTTEQVVLMFREALQERGYPVPRLAPDVAHLAGLTPDEEFKRAELESLLREWRGEG